MNIKFLKIVAVALTLAVMAFGLSCKNDKPADNEPDFSGRIAVNLTADIVSPGKLKVANDEWEPSDKVGLFMKKAGLATPDALYEDVANVQTSIVGQKLTASPPVFYPLDGNVDFIAYYPYVPDASIGAGYTIDLNVSGQDAGLPVETLYSNNVVEQAPTTSAVALNFNYSLAKLVVTVKEKSNNYLTADDFAGMLVAVEGMNTQAKLQLLDGTLTDEHGGEAITLHPTGSATTSAAFEALVLPFEGEAVFMFAVGVDTYRCVVDGSFDAATQYALTFLLDVLDPNRTVTMLNAIITPRTVTTLMYAVGDFINVNENLISGMQVDPLEKLFNRDVAYTVENTAAAEAAKGETATFQFVLRSEYPISDLKITALPLTSGAEQIPATLKAFVRYSKINNPVYTPVYPEYPDCLWDEELMNVPANKNQPVWVEYQIPRDAATGDYSATLVFSGSVNGASFAIAKEVNAKVYPVIVPEQTLWVSNWMSYTSNMTKINGGVAVSTNEPLFWDLVKVVANTARAHGQNTYNFWRELFSVAYLGNSLWSFDFSLFDKLVETFIREGGLKRIEIGPVSEPMPAGFSVYVPGIGFCLWNDPNTESYLSQYLPALYNHLESKGWKDMTYQHIGDEPNDANAGPTSWNNVANLVKTIRPDIKIIEAVSATSISANMDVWAPLLDYWGNNYSFYWLQQQMLGKELWFYTCATPQGAYANRFMETPALRTRYLHWLNYRYRATGYLHWGFNFWTENMTIDHIQNYWPAGDEFVVYPGYRKLYTSIRLAAQRDGIADYELLKLLEKTNQSKAQEIASRIIKGFDNYDENINNFRQARKELLEALSQ